MAPLSRVLAMAPLAPLDHLVYATPHLERTLDDLERALGVRPLPGGAHPAWGTRNAILPLGPATYLEVIGPDPARQESRPVIFQLATLSSARLVTWAAKGSGLTALVAGALGHGIRLGALMQGARERPDGTRLSWELTDPLTVVDDGLIPFFIDWGASPHPATSSEAVVTLEEFRAEHPEPERVGARLALLGAELAVAAGPRPRLVATLLSPAGVVTLR